MDRKIGKIIRRGRRKLRRNRDNNTGRTGAEGKNTCLNNLLAFL